MNAGRIILTYDICSFIIVTRKIFCVEISASPLLRVPHSSTLRVRIVFHVFFKCRLQILAPPEDKIQGRISTLSNSLLRVAATSETQVLSGT